MSFRWLFFRYLPPGVKTSHVVRRKIKSLGLNLIFLIPMGLMYLYLAISIGSDFWIYFLFILPALWLVLAVLGRWFIAGTVIDTVRKASKEHCLACDYPREGLNDDIPGDDDGTVAVVEAHLAEETAAVQIATGHTRLSFTYPAIRHVLHFLKHRSFELAESSK